MRALAAELDATLPRLDVLVNNAGLHAATRRTLSADGYDLTFAVNHLAPFLLTNLLLPASCSARPARASWSSPRARTGGRTWISPI